MKKLLARTGLVLAGAVAGVAVAPATVQAAVNYFDTTKTVSGTGTASCPSGWRLTGGGTATLPRDYFGSSYSDEYAVTGSFPSGNTWKATGTRVHGTYSGSSGWRFTTYSYSPRVSAICAN